MANIPISSLPVAIALDGTEYVPLVQGGTTKRATIAQISTFPATSASFVTATSESVNLPSSRLLSEETGVTTITDAGAGSTITVGIAINGISNSKFRQSGALSVVGNATNATANVADIAAASDDQILRRNGSSIGFGSINLAQSGAVGTSILAPLNGGTGVNNGGNTLTLGGSLATVGAFSTTFNFTGPTNVTFPTSGTLATTAGPGLPAVILGDTLYGSGPNTLAALAGNTTATRQYLSQTGNGAISAAPVWTAIAGVDVTGAALTAANDTNVTLTLGGSAATALLRTASLTAGWSGQLALSRGGTNANLVPSNGGIFYSTATSGAIVSGTATARQMLQSGANSAPAWSTTAWPATSTANQILYSSSSNTIGEITTANNGVLITSGAGVPSISSTLPVVVQTNITQLGTVTTGTWNASIIGLGYGGTAANLTASNGGLVYSTASALAVLSGTATAGQIPRSGSSSAPSWSTATYPSTTAAGTVMASATANVLAATATPTLGANGGTGGSITLNGSTSGSVTISVAAAAGTGTVFQLPNSNGVNGQVLSTNGSGLTSWIAAGGTGTVTSLSPGSGLTTTITGAPPGSAVTTTGTFSSAQVVTTNVNTSYAIVDSDRASLIISANAAAQAFSLPQAGASSQFQAGWWVDINNISSTPAGVLTITPTTSTINGLSSLVLQKGQSVRIVSDGTNYRIVHLTGVRRVLRQVFTSSGTYTPSTGMLYADIEALGGGGGGGGVAGAVGLAIGSNGGGAGSTSWRVVSAATVGASQTVTIGAAGTGASAGANAGGPGGDTSVGTLCIGKGGSGGGGSSSGGPGSFGAGGIAGTGDVTGVGQNGGQGNYLTFSAQILNPSGAGGSTRWGTGGSGTVQSSGAAANGAAGSGYGAGGGGGNANQVASSAAGGAGTAGLVIITEYCS